MQQLTSKPAFASVQVQLVYAEVLARAKTPAKDKEVAKQILIKLKDADVDPAQLARVAAFLGSDVVDELDLPEGDKPKKDPKPPRRRGNKTK